MPKKPKTPATVKVKTSMALPADLWTRVRIKALQEGVDAQDIVARALEASLNSKRGGKR